MHIIVPILYSIVSLEELFNLNLCSFEYIASPAYIFVLFVPQLVVKFVCDSAILLNAIPKSISLILVQLKNISSIFVTFVVSKLLPKSIFGILLQFLNNPLIFVTFDVLNLFIPIIELIFLFPANMYCIFFTFDVSKFGPKSNSEIISHFSNI